MQLKKNGPVKSSEYSFVEKSTRIGSLATSPPFLFLKSLFTPCVVRSFTNEAPAVANSFHVQRKLFSVKGIIKHYIRQLLNYILLPLLVNRTARSARRTQKFGTIRCPSIATFSFPPSSSSSAISATSLSSPELFDSWL